MDSNKSHCIHESQISTHDKEIARLNVRSDFKERIIKDLDHKIEKMDKKMDELLESFNEFKIQSNQYDTNIELRVKELETKQELQEKEANRRTVWIGIALTVITILINVYFQTKGA